MKFYDRIIALFEGDFQATRGFITGEALPFLENLLRTVEEDAVTNLKPFAEQAVAAVVADAGALVSGAGWAAVVPLAFSQMTTLLTAAGKEIEKVAGADIHTALGAALANAQAALSTATPAAPAAQTPPAAS